MVKNFEGSKNCVFFVLTHIGNLLTDLKNSGMEKFKKRERTDYGDEDGTDPQDRDSSIIL